MRKKLNHKFSLAIVLLVLGILVSTSIVYAPWQSLGSGYAITSNYHGIDVPLTPVTVTAGTTDSSVMNITFRWHFPNDSVTREVHVFPLLTSPYPPPDVPQEVIDYVNSTTVWYAQDTYVPDVLGDWGVQAFFRDSTGKEKANLTNVISIRATSFNVVPEIPLGTIGAAATMIIALGLFVLKKKKTVKIPRKF